MRNKFVAKICFQKKLLVIIWFPKTFFKNNIYGKSDTTAQGYVIPELYVDNKINTNKLFTSLSLSTKLFSEKLTLNTGVRVDYFDYVRLKTTFSPRAGS